MTPAALLGETSRIVHGTTVATNALLEGKTAPVGLLTTEGHRDVIEMREGLKPDRYNLRMAPPEPLVPRQLRLPVRERMRPDGSVAIALDKVSLDQAIVRLAEANVRAVAICFLHAWRNPAHELQAAAAVRARLQDAYVTTSSDVLPRIKEFERFSTTVANAAVGPVIDTYLHRLRDRLAEAGYRGELLVILSHGGVATVAEATRLAAGTALSGPAGGVAAAVALVSRRRGKRPDRLRHGRHVHRYRTWFATGSRLVRRQDCRECADRFAVSGYRDIGAGGGSIGRVDAAGLLAVGPESAGADPGPACYGQGGTEATVTDANLVLGYLDPANFLGGRRMLDRDAAAAAVRGSPTVLG